MFEEGGLTQWAAWRRRTLNGLVASAIASFSLAPVVGIFGASFSPSAFWQFPPAGISLEWYSEFFARPQMVNSAFVSFSTAVFVALVGTAIALLAALALARSTLDWRARDAVGIALLLPLLIPPTALGIAIYSMYTQFRVPITLLSLGAAQLILVIPLIAGLLVTGLDGIRPNVERAAANLGAGPADLFRRVTFPLITPALLASAILGFVRSFDDAGIALFVAVPSTMTLPVRMLLAMDQEYRPLIAVSGSILLIVAAAVAVTLDRTIGLPRAFGLRG